MSRTPLEQLETGTQPAQLEGFALQIVEATARADVEQRVQTILGAGWQIAAFDATGVKLEVIPTAGNDEILAGISVGQAWSLTYRLRRLPGVLYAEPLFAVAMPVPTVPRNPSALTAPVPTLQPGLAAMDTSRMAFTEGTTSSSAADGDCEWSLKQINVPQAWTKFFGDKLDTAGAGIVIGHPDTGYQPHPEIMANLLLAHDRDFIGDHADNTNAIDDLSHEGFVLIPNPGHGTGTSSVIISRRGRQLPGTEAGTNFVSGVAPGAKLVPLRVTYSVVLFSMRNLANAIRYAADEGGAHVISISLSGPPGSWFLHDAILYAQRKGLIIAAAAGNYVPFVAWPAAYEEVIAVAASTADRTAWKWSGYGSQIDVTAPGAGVWHAIADRLGDGSVDMTIGQGDGTSFGVATVAGVAALWLSRWGRDSLIQKYGAEKVPLLFNKLLKDTSDPSPDFIRSGNFGKGIVNTFKLLDTPLPDPQTSTGFALSPSLEGAAHPPVDSGNLMTFTHLFETFAPGQRLNTPFLNGGFNAPSALSDALCEVLGTDTRHLEGDLKEAGQELAFHLAVNPALYARFQTLLQRKQAARAAVTTAGGTGGQNGSMPALTASPSTSAALLQALSGEDEPASQLRDALRQPAAASEVLQAFLNRTPIVAAPSVVPVPSPDALPDQQAVEKVAADKAVAAQAAAGASSDYRAYALPTPVPPARRLRVYAFDPSLSTQMDTAVINRVTMSVKWEPKLKVGPVGEYVEVVDVDPASNCFYAPVDLNDPFLLAQDGLQPSEGNPQFHQQMVYAVAMNTIRSFETALGRMALWSPHRWKTTDADGNDICHEEYIDRLRIYPHALREANAYYSPEKKALLFGYFPASSDDPGNHFPGGVVFTCLSQDVVAHETTHALLDGMHRRFIEPTNPDMLAFHEAFADIVALFQHFSMPDVLRNQIGKTRGDLKSQNMLGQLAQQFGQATGGHGALRDALGKVNPKTGAWEPLKPNPSDLQTVWEPHSRGAILVAAVFDAFLSIYQSRIADLLRIATNGTGVLPSGEISPDLVTRLANEAAKSAGHVLTMCIRALDYCPPVDITFGEYLRAVITADYDMVPNDAHQYRVAFIEGFRRRGIYPRDVRTLSVDSLLWKRPSQLDLHPAAIPFALKLKSLVEDWGLSGNREEIYNRTRKMRADLHDWIKDHLTEEKDTLAGLNLSPGALIEVHSIRPARRTGPDGEIVTHLVVEITQRRPETLSDPSSQEVGQNADPTPVQPAPAKPDFYFRGGCTLLIDLRTGEVRYAIFKNINSTSRLQRQKDFLLGKHPGDNAAALAAAATTDNDTYLRQAYYGWMTEETGEPFALLHRAAPRSRPHSEEEGSGQQQTSQDTGRQ